MGRDNGSPQAHMGGHRNKMNPITQCGCEGLSASGKIPVANFCEHGNELIFLLFCTMTNKRIIISQIITLLHVSTLSYHPQTDCNQYLAKLHQYLKCSCR